MKIILTIICMLTMHINVMGQTLLSEEQSKSVLDKVNDGALSMKSMQCEFTQTKSVKMLNKSVNSGGVMYFKRPNKLRWQYTNPYEYIFILNGNKVNIKSAKTNKEIDINGNKIFNQISSIILNCVTGGNLKNSQEFRLELYQTGTKYFAKLFPKKKELKQVYNYIEVYFNQSLTMVDEVRMEEKSGEATVVQLSNVKKNVAIDEKIFSIR